MGRPYEVSLVSNTRGFVAGLREAGNSVEDITDSLNDLTRDAARQGDRAGEGLSDGIEDGARDAGDATERLERSFRDVSTAARRESREAGRDLGNNIQDGSRRAQDGIDEIGDSARQNSIETAASFDGSFQSISDGAQGLVAEAFAGFGPAGVVAGIAAAAGIGLISTAFEQAGEDAEALAQRTSDAYEDMKESGLNYLTETRIGEGIDEITNSQDKLNQAYKDAAESGASISTVLRAQAGDYDAIALVQATASATQETLTQKQEAYKLQTGDTSAQIDSQIYALDDLKGRFSAVAGTTDTAAARINLYRDAMSQSGPVADAAAAKANNLSGALDSIKSPRPVVFDVDDSRVRDAINRIQNQTVRVQADLEFRSGGRVL